MTPTTSNLHRGTLSAKRAGDPESDRMRVATAWILVWLLYLIFAIGIYLIWQKANNPS